MKRLNMAVTDPKLEGEAENIAICPFGLVNHFLHVAMLYALARYLTWLLGARLAIKAKLNWMITQRITSTYEPVAL